MDGQVSLRPVMEEDLSWLAFLNDPAAIGPFYGVLRDEVRLEDSAGLYAAVMTSFWRGWRGSAVAGCAVILIGSVAACSSSPASTASTLSASAPAITVPAQSLASPGCSTATAKAPELRGIRTSMLRLPGDPFGVVVTPDGRWAFVALQGSVEVLKVTSTSLTPTVAARVPVPGSTLGDAVTSDGRYVLAADGSGAVVIDVVRATRGDGARAVLGTLSDPKLVGGRGSAIEVALSRGNDYAFVTNEYSDLAAVFNLRRALADGFGPGDYVGAIPLGEAAVGMAVSPDGRWLYATSEGKAHTASQTGTLSVISVAKAENDPARSVVATVDAGCNPVRVITAANGSEVWVTARASDDLLCFAASRLRSDPSRALVAVVRVGELPVGLALTNGGSRIIVADSNRFNVGGAVSSLAVVNVAAALSGKPAMAGYLPAGQFPREMALEPGGRRLLVTNFASGQLETVSLR